MNKALPFALSFLLLGCNGTLVFKHPQFIPSYHDGKPMRFDAEVSPKQVRLGDTVTLRVSGFPDEEVTQAYLTSADAAQGGDPEDPEAKSYRPPAMRLGRLKPINDVATLSFEVRATMGNDQFGDPFTLAASQSWTVMLTHQDKYGRKGTTGSDQLNFTILP